MKNKILFGLATALGGFVLGTFITVRAQPSQARQELPQPASWVPFSATAMVYLTGKPPQTGRYYRNHNGSERWEVSRTDADETVIEISNVEMSTFYTKSPANGWVSKPTDLNVNNNHPMHWSVPMAGLSRYEYKLDIRKGGTGQIKASKGFDAYVYTMANGDSRVLIPDLNFFAAVQQRLGTVTRIYSNVELREPSSDLFMPEAGEIVTPLATPMKFKEPHMGHAK